MQSIRLFVTDRQLAAVLTVSPADRGDVQGSKSARTPNPILWQGHLATRIARVVLNTICARAWHPSNDAGENRDEARRDD
jgi:hypothetical protein